MDNRKLLEVFGKKNQSLQIEGSSVIYKESNGSETIIPIGSIRMFKLTPPSIWAKYGVIEISTPGLRSADLWFPLRDLEQFRPAEDMQKHIASFQTSDMAVDASLSCKLDKIAKLKALLDDGAITQEEFGILKKELIDM